MAAALTTIDRGLQMKGMDGAARPRLNVWIALGGVLLLGALAFGLLQNGANASPPAGAAGYNSGPGTTNGNKECRMTASNGYIVACPSNVSAVKTHPAEPKAHKGFKVSFESKSGGSYKVYATRKGHVSNLEEGATGAGKTTTKRVGKSLKTGKYRLVVSVYSSIKVVKAAESLRVKK
jgi:hypothetical protein